jgi:ubiquinone/menaquinone biosynthesis C-methylase UbiE/uncharacterized protein YbaR (Trm112 family)
MTSATFSTNALEAYVCPTCRGDLREEQDVLLCAACSRTYAAKQGVPDFLGGSLARSADPQLRRMATIDHIARIYETRLWYPLVLKVICGAKSLTLQELVRRARESMAPVQGRVIDIACGPGTYGRRVASDSREVFGIDVSMEMLRQGAVYSAKEGIEEMHFARARVEALPFADGFFDGALCCGSLHLFTDTAKALGEMARVMRPGAVLSVFTFTQGDSGLLKFRRVIEWYRRNYGLHVFEPDEMERYLSLAGFVDFRPKVSGSVLAFTARRQTA